MNAGIPNENLQMKASQIFLEYHAYVRTIAFHTAPNRNLIGDIVNDVFVEFVQNAEKWDFERELRPLLASITENIARQYWRKYLKNSTAALKRIGLWIQSQLADSSSEESRTQEEVHAMGSCLDKLPKEGRILLEAHYFDDVPITELATQTGHNINTLYSIMSRLRQTLRRCVEKHLGTGGIVKTDARELAILTGKYLDGTLDETEAERLESLLTDPETATFFLDNICADRILHDRGHAIEHDSMNWFRPVVFPQQETTTEYINEQLLRAGLSLPQTTANNNVFAKMGKYGKKYLVRIALAVFCISLLTLGLIREYRSAVQTRTVVKITETSNCLWSRIPTVMDKQMGIGPGIIELQSGLATLEFNCGAVMTLESPSRLEIVNEKRCYLHEGRSIVEAIPDSAKGFIVETPFVSVTDEGTKFSLDVREQMANISVLEGQVKTSCSRTRETCRLTKNNSKQFGSLETILPSNDDKNHLSRIIQLSTATHGGREAWVMADPSFLSFTRAQFNYPASENFLQIKRGNGSKNDILSDRRVIFGIDLSDLKKTDFFRSVQLKLNFGNTELGFASVLPDCHYIVYGLTDETKDNWNEKEMNWKTLPGQNSHRSLDSNCYKPVAEFTMKKGVLEQVVVLDDPRLMDFIKHDTNGFVTFVVEDTSQATDVDGYVHGIAGRHHPKLAPPTLLFHYDSADKNIAKCQ